jgi:hypothetical protein
MFTATRNLERVKQMATTKIATYKTREDFERVAKSIISASGRNRSLMQEASVAVIAHMKEHGDYTVMFPLAIAALTFGNNLTKAWQGWMTAHTWLVYNPQGMRGRQLSTAEQNKLWGKEAGTKRECDPDKAASVNWYDYKAKSDKAEGEGNEVNAPDAIKRFHDRMVKALVAGNIVGADGKPVTLATVKKMLTSMIETIDADVTKGLREKAQQPATETNVGTPVKRAVKAGENVVAKAARKPRQPKAPAPIQAAA